MRDIDDAYQRAYLNIMFTAATLESEAANILKPYGISLPQFNILRILRGQKDQPISATDIKERMLHKNSNVTRILDKLIEKKLVHIVGCKHNRRKIDVTITEEGLQLLKSLDKSMHMHTHKFQNSMKQEDAEQLGNLLDLIHA